MQQPSDFLLGSWKVRPRLNRVERGDEVRNLQPKWMELLVCLSRHPNEVLSKESLLETVWNDTYVGEGVLTTAVAEIRKTLEDDSKHPSVIETVRKRGYRLIARVQSVSDVSESRSFAFPVSGAFAVTALLASSLLGFGWWMVGRMADREEATAKPLWALVADVENRTGESLFDGTLGFALEQQLTNATGITAVTRERINDVLRLMRQPPSVLIDEKLGSEICIRDGNIRALVTGRIEKVGVKYLLGLRITDPFNGSLVAATSRQATTHDEILDMVSELSAWARKSLGDFSSKTEAQSSLEPVTTSSIRALYLYSQAMRLSRDEPRSESRIEPLWTTVETLLLDAVREDSDFAAAHLLLGWSLFNRHRPSEEVLAHADRAVALAPAVSEWERHFIMASYYRFTGEDDKEFSELEALVAIRPDHYWGINNLANWHFRNHRPCDRVDESRCTVHVKHWADLRPQGFIPNMLAAIMLARGQGDFEAADPFVRRATALLEEEFDRGVNTAWMDIFPFHRAWMNNDSDTALQALDPVVTRLAAARVGQRHFYLWRLGSAYLTLGRLEQARQTFAWMDPGPLRELYLAMTAYVADRPEQLREHLLEYLRHPNYGEVTGAILLVRAGLWERAETLLVTLREKGLVCEAALQVVEGEIALAKGQVAAGTVRLQEAFGLVPIGFPEYLLAAETLAQTLYQSGQASTAIAALEQVSLRRPRTLQNAAFLWLRVRFELAEMYRQTGKLEKALQLEAELRQLLKQADSRHPLVLSLHPS